MDTVHTQASAASFRRCQRRKSRNLVGGGGGGGGDTCCTYEYIWRRGTGGSRVSKMNFKLQLFVECSDNFIPLLPTVMCYYCLVGEMMDSNPGLRHGRQVRCNCRCSPINIVRLLIWKLVIVKFNKSII